MKTVIKFCDTNFHFYPKIDKSVKGTKMTHLFVTMATHPVSSVVQDFENVVCRQLGSFAPNLSGDLGDQTGQVVCLQQI